MSIWFRGRRPTTPSPERIERAVRLARQELIGHAADQRQRESPEGDPALGWMVVSLDNPNGDDQAALIPSGRYPTTDPTRQRSGRPVLRAGRFVSAGPAARSTEPGTVGGGPTHGDRADADRFHRPASSGERHPTLNRRSITMAGISQPAFGEQESVVRRHRQDGRVTADITPGHLGEVLIEVRQGRRGSGVLRGPGSDDQEEHPGSGGRQPGVGLLRWRRPTQ